MVYPGDAVSPQPFKRGYETPTLGMSPDML